MRLDQVLVDDFNIESRTKAQTLIANGKVQVNGRVVDKPGFKITAELRSKIEILDLQDLKFVSRAGLKLEMAINKLKLEVQGQRVLDVGQSTGGFSDCVLQLGAVQVVGIDVGHDQLHPKLKQNPACLSLENLNVKNLKESDHFQKLIPQGKFDLLVMDVSFISLTQVVEHVAPFLKSGGAYLVLVKPQFECGPELLDKHGRVQDHQFYSILEKNMRGLFTTHFGTVMNYLPSELLGKEGNTEFFIYGKKI